MCNLNFQKMIKLWMYKFDLHFGFALEGSSILWSIPHTMVNNFALGNWVSKIDQFFFLPQLWKIIKAGTNRSCLFYQFLLTIVPSQQSRASCLAPSQFVCNCLSLNRLSPISCQFFPPFFQRSHSFYYISSFALGLVPSMTSTIWQSQQHHFIFNPIFAFLINFFLISHSMFTAPPDLCPKHHSNQTFC